MHCLRWQLSPIFETLEWGTVVRSCMVKHSRGGITTASVIACILGWIISYLQKYRSIIASASCKGKLEIWSSECSIVWQVWKYTHFHNLGGRGHLYYKVAMLLNVNRDDHMPMHKYRKIVKFWKIDTCHWNIEAVPKLKQLPKHVTFFRAIRAILAPICTSTC